METGSARTVARPPRKAAGIEQSQTEGEALGAVGCRSREGHPSPLGPSVFHHEPQTPDMKLEGLVCSFLAVPSCLECEHSLDRPLLDIRTMLFDLTQLRDH